MSKLSDRIKKTRRAAPKPLGFTPSSSAAPEPTMLAVARLDPGDAGKIADAAEAGADVVVVASLDEKKLQKSIDGSAAVCGVQAGDADRAKVKALIEAGVDFIVVESAGRAEALLEDAVGHVLSVPPDTEDTELRLIGDLSPDAVIVPAIEGMLSVGSALRLRRIATLARSPLFTEVDPSIGESELEALRSAGVTGAIVPGREIGKLKKLRKTIESLPERKTRRDDRQEAMLPIGVPARTNADHDDEEED